MSVYIDIYCRDCSINYRDGILRKTLDKPRCCRINFSVGKLSVRLKSQENIEIGCFCCVCYPFKLLFSLTKPLK